MPEEQIRHILGLSGGKDSAALAVLMHKRIPQMEYFFCDTGKELDETYEYLDRLQARLGIKIVRLAADRGFDHWLSVYGGMLPSPRARWCTKTLKIEPIERFVGDDKAYSYIGIRADEENRKGYISTKDNIRPVFPFIDESIKLNDVIRILEDFGLGLPKYYQWRSRSGCYFCFYQRKIEWIKLADNHPERFWEAVEYEETNGAAGYTWAHGESLRDILARREEIELEYEQNRRTAAERKRLTVIQDQPLVDVLAALDVDDEEPGCTVCHW